MNEALLSAWSTLTDRRLALHHTRGPQHANYAGNTWQTVRTKGRVYLPCTESVEDLFHDSTTCLLSLERKCRLQVVVRFTFFQPKTQQVTEKLANGSFSGTERNYQQTAAAPQK